MNSAWTVTVTTQVPLKRGFKKKLKKKKSKTQTQNSKCVSKPCLSNFKMINIPQKWNMSKIALKFFKWPKYAPLEPSKWTN